MYNIFFNGAGISYTDMSRPTRTNTDAQIDCSKLESLQIDFLTCNFSKTPKVKNRFQDFLANLKIILND